MNLLFRSVGAASIAAATLAFAVGAHAAAPKIPMDNPAVAFLDTVINQKKTQEAFDKYVGPEYIQHNPGVPSGREAAIKLLSGFATPGSPVRYEFKRVLVDGDLVAIHAHLVPKPGDRGTAVVDIFRLENGKIVEHWDVLQPVPEKAANTNTMF